MRTSLRRPRFQSLQSLEMIFDDGTAPRWRNNSVGTSSDPVSVETQLFEIVSADSKDHWISSSAEPGTQLSPRTQSLSKRNTRQRSISLQNINELPTTNYGKTQPRNFTLPSLTKRGLFNPVRTGRNSNHRTNGGPAMFPPISDRRTPNRVTTSRHHANEITDRHLLYNVEEEEDLSCRIWKWLNDDEYCLQNDVFLEYETWEEPLVNRSMETAIRIVYTGDEAPV